MPTHDNDKTVIKGQLYKVPCIKQLIEYER